MGEARRNRQAILKAMLPAFPINADFTGVDIRGGFMLRRDLVILPADQLREVDGKPMMLVDEADGPQWRPVPDGARVAIEGTQLGYDALDYVISVYGLRQDKSTLIGASGQQQGGVTAMKVAELARIPAEEFMARLGQRPEVQG